MVQAGFSMVTVKLILIIAFLFFTSPAATHALARAALSADVKPLLGKSGDGEGTASKT
jgi:multicomponent Na+:H+ antiporter subunit G